MSARRTEIVAIARTLFAANGYASTSTRDIAEASSLLPGSLYSHFRSKAQILELAMAPFFEELAGAMRIVADDATASTGAERVETMVRRVVAVCAGHPAELRILHYDWPHIHAARELDELIEHTTETLDLWHKIVDTGIEDGTLRASLHAETVLRIITSAIHGVLDRQRYGTRPDLLDELGLEHLSDQLVAILIPGLRAQ